MIKKLTSHFLFSVDTIFAWAAYFLLSAILLRPASIICFLLIWVCAHIFDIDGIPFKLLRRCWRKQKRYDLLHEWWSHWFFGHFLILVPLYALSAAWISTQLLPGSFGFMLFLSVLCLLEHLVHDGRQWHGVPLFGPFSWQHFTFADGWPRKADPDDISDRQEELAFAKGRGDIDKRIKPPTPLRVFLAFAELWIFAVWKTYSVLYLDQSFLS